MYQESEILELKRDLTDDILKEIIAFSNTKGGRIIIGINDEGQIIGVSDSKDICEKLSSKINDNIKPSIIGIISISIFEEQGKELISIEILRGTNRPYYLSKKGLKPTGVFVRLGNTSIPASEVVIRDLIRDSDNYRFEDSLSFKQDLKFEYTKTFFQKRDIGFENRSCL